MLLFLSVCLNSLHGQQSFTSTGGDFSGPGGSVSFSLGQAAWTTVSGLSGSMAHGVQQPYEIMVVTGLDDDPGFLIDMSAYPNPSAGRLLLTVSGLETEQLHFGLFDLNGRLLMSAKIRTTQTDIPMTSYPPAAYQLVIYNESGKIRTFQIIKQQ
jgi:hypothetical protein